MKILCYNQSDNSKLFNLIKPLQDVDNCTVGNCGRDIDSEAIDEFKPDIIIHDIPNVDSFPHNNNFISININELDGKNCFSLENPQSKNYIEPFVTIRPIKEDPRKYESDIVYIGNPSVFGKDLLSNIILLNYRFKFFTDQFLNVLGYCGCCHPGDYFTFYKYSKACIVMDNDIYRTMDILAAGGNPIVYKGNDDTFLDKLKEAVVNNKKYTIDGIDRESVLSKNTNYDRIATILQKVGLSKLKNEVLKEKKKAIL